MQVIVTQEPTSVIRFATMVKRDSIQVPAAFPNILKIYAKDMIRTQPCDILCWSAAYFRCIANNVQPPTKSRFEGNAQDDHLTKEFLKTLVKQIGKGYFVDRNLLQTRWKGLGLPQHELFVLLGASGMLGWDIVHWLKLVAVMAASISENFESSITLMCETLSEDAEGGPSSIPLWMFNVGYTFLATLDGSVKQKGGHAPTEEKPLAPIQLSSVYFRDSLVGEWQQFAASHPNANVSSNLIFGNAFDGFKKSTEFENLIELLKDIEMFRSHTVIINDNEKDKFDQSIVMHELGAPWSWMFEFVEHNKPANKSYNFIEIGEIDEQKDEPHATPVGDDNREIDDTAAGVAHANNSFERDNNQVDVDVPVMPGVGGPIQKRIASDFINYLRGRSIDENGMIFPRHFKEADCPKMGGN